MSEIVSLLPLKRSFSFPQEWKAEDQNIEDLIIKNKSPRISDSCKDSFFPDDECTLLKCVQYPGIDKDEHVEIQEAIEIIKSECCRRPKTEDYFKKLKLIGLDPGEEPIRAGPVFQVISVKIVNRRDSSWSNIDIYGDISVTDDKDNTFFIYKRESHESEVLFPESNMLSLNGCPIAPLMRGNVKVNLTCKGGGDFQGSDVQIIAATHEVDYSIKDPSGNGNLPLVFFGEYGYYALMEFTIIPFAFISMVDFIFLIKHPRQQGKEIIDLDGQIKVNNVVCVEKQSIEFSEWNRPVKQSRNVFAVPVNASHLLVEFLLHRGGTEFAIGSLKINPGGLRADSFYFDCEEERFGFKIDVDWILHEGFFNRENRSYQEHVKWGSEYLPMDYQIDKPFGATEPGTYVEVFSVFVGGGNSSDHPLAICGTILVQHQDETVYIFSRNEGCPDKLSNEQSRTLSLVWSTKGWVVEKDFHMNFKLKDFKGLPLCRGSICWPDDWDWHPPGYDTRKCDVIQGINGYFAAVHYSIFRNGKKAKVTIEYKGPYRHLLVYGSIFAEFDNYDYRSTYDQDYYRIIIFKKSKEDHVVVKNLSELPLSKSNVSAPSDCKELTVDVKLVVCPSMASPDQLVSIRLPFKADRNDVFNLHGGHLRRRECRMGLGCVNCCITMKVEWPKFSQL